MNWTQYKPAIMVLASVLVAVGGGMVGTRQEHSKGEARAVVAAQKCDSTVRVVEAQRAAAVARVDSVIRVVEVQDLRATVGASASALAVSRGHECRCSSGSHGRGRDKQPSFLARWAPPLVGLAAGIAIGHSWAPRAVQTIVNVMDDGGGGDDDRDHMHMHGHRWYHGKKHHKGGGHDEHGRKDDD